MSKRTACLFGAAFILSGSGSAYSRQGGSAFARARL
jgi:hypothetical protein